MTLSKSCLEPSFFIGGRKIDIVSSFKYMGLVLKSNEISHLNTRDRRSSKKSSFRPAKNDKLFYNALITPILEYGSELWDHQSRENLDIEKIHRKFCKFILNVPSTTVNSAVYGE